MEAVIEYPTPEFNVTGTSSTGVHYFVFLSFPLGFRWRPASYFNTCRKRHSYLVDSVISWYTIAGSRSSDVYQVEYILILLLDLQYLRQ